MDLAAVVLAGGRSARFGHNKLLQRIDGRPVLGRITAALQGVTSRLYLSVSEDAPVDDYREATGAEIVRDNHGIGCVGPALGMCSALLSIEAENYLIVPGDVPWLDAETVKRFVKFSIESGSQVVAPAWKSGMVEILFQFHRGVPPQRQEITHLPQIRRESMRPSDFLRAFDSCFVGVGRISKNPFCFSNLNTQADLHRRRTRGELTTKTETIIIADTRARRFFNEGIEAQAASSYKEAALSFASESEFYEEKGPRLLALHALADALHCLQLGGIESSGLAQRLRSLKLSLPIAPRS